MEVRITASLQYIDINVWKSLVRTFMEKVFQDAGKLFLTTAISKLPKPWTGHSASAFRNLGDAVGRSISIGKRTLRVRTDRRGARQVRILRDEYYYPPGGGRVKKTTQSGRQFATPAEDIINVTGVKLASGRAAFYFKFEVDITYFNLLDRDRWHSFEEGTKVFDAYIREKLEEIPGIEKALVRKKVQ